MSLRVLDLERDGALWDAALSGLPPQLHDVYFTAAYHLVWQRNGDGLARGAIFENADGAVLYPFLLRPLDTAPALVAATGHGGDPWRGRFDISSAYGYGGPLAAVAGEEPLELPDDPEAASGTGPGPVVTPASARLLAAFRHEFSAWCREQGIVSEFIRFHPLLQTEAGMTAAADADPTAGAETGGATPSVEIVPANVTVWCRLSTPEAHRATLSSSARRNLRKADRAELTFGVETSDEAWARFIELYTETMRRREASDYYLFPPRYFDDCRELLGDAAALLTVRRPAPAVSVDGAAGLSAARGDVEPGEIVAAAFFLRSEQAIHYHLGGSDSAALAERPNNLLFVGAMDWGAELGAAAMHLGGGYLAGGEDELLRFKTGFSPLRARFYMGRCVHDQVRYDEAVISWRATGGEDSGGYFPAYRAPLPG
jgi:serine/alanine adding enzyme